MSELPIKAGHDPLSSLIYQTAKNMKIEIRLIGNGAHDMHNLLTQYHNLGVRAEEYENAFKTIMRYLQDQKLPEEQYGYCCATLLAMRVNIDLKTKQ